MRKAIPWEYDETGSIKIWRWLTNSFEVTVFSEGSAKKTFGWRIVDRSQGRDIPFDSSTATSFNEAVESILELIGKSYEPSLGYQAYAGELATTFAISTGHKVDFAPLIGETVIVKVIEDDLEERIIRGVLHVSNYVIRILTDSTSAVNIPPNRIRDVQKEYGGRSILDNSKKSSEVTSTRMKRVFNTEYTKGCTGRPGFKPNTVEHGPGDSYCPIHNV